MKVETEKLIRVKRNGRWVLISKKVYEYSKGSYSKKGSRASQRASKRG